MPLIRDANTGEERFVDWPLRKFTPVESITAHLVCNGMTLHEIAHVRGKTLCTVRLQFKLIMTKLGVDDPARAVAILRGAPLVQGEYAPTYAHLSTRARQKLAQSRRILLKAQR